jgi:hypothetical protein
LVTDELPAPPGPPLDAGALVEVVLVVLLELELVVLLLLEPQPASNRATPIKVARSDPAHDLRVTVSSFSGSPSWRGVYIRVCGAPSKRGSVRGLLNHLHCRV